MTKTSKEHPNKRLKGAAPIGERAGISIAATPIGDGARTTPAGDAPLDRRKTSILGTVVYEYIATGEPVGSATLTQKYNLGVSAATVRAEMASLEEDDDASDGSADETRQYRPVSLNAAAQRLGALLR